MRFIQLCLGALLGISLSAPLLAQDGLKLSGFGSIGTLSTNSEQAGFRRDNADPKVTLDGELNISSLSLLGLQANYQLLPNLEFVGQVLLGDHPEQNADNILRIAALNYEPIPDWQIRLGRMSQRIYLLSDSRPIGYANLWTMPVQEFYSLLTYNFIDGVDSTYSLPLGRGYLRTNISYGKTSIYINEAHLGTTNFDLSDVSGLNFEYEIDDWMVRAAWAQATPDGNLQSQQNLKEALQGLSQLLMWQQGFAFAEKLDTTNHKVQFTSAALTFNNGEINFKSELGRLESDSLIIPNVTSAYVSIGKVMNKFTPFILLGYVQSDNSQPPDLSPPIQTPELMQLLAASTAAIESGYDQQSFGLGLRYEINSKASVKIQWDRKWIGKKGYSLWVPDENFQYPSESEVFDVLSTRLDFIF